MSGFFNPPNAERFTFTHVYVPDPVLTFGVELEFVHVMRIEILKDLARQKGLDPALAIDNVAELARRYLAAKLMRAVPGISDQGPNYLGQILMAEVHGCDYNHWNLGGDASVGCMFHEMIPMMQGLDVSTERLLNWHWEGAELASEILVASEVDNWFPKLEQIQDQLAATGNEGGFTSRHASTGLHVHVRLVDHMNMPMFERANQGVPMLLKNILILWAAYEDELDSFQPYHRRAGNIEYALSLRPERSIQPWNPVTFATRVYSCNTIEQLIRAVFCENTLTPKYFKISISPARPNKDFTLEFREHRGTLNAEEITWWVKLIEAFVMTARSLTQFGWMLESVDDLVISMPVLELINFHEAGKVYYNAKREFFKDDRAGANDNGSDYTISDDEEEDVQDVGQLAGLAI